MVDKRTQAERLMTIETKLDAMPGLITAAIQAQVGPLLTAMGRHDERIEDLEQQADRLAVRLWQIAVALATMLIGEVFWVWHSLTNSIPKK